MVTELLSTFIPRCFCRMTQVLLRTFLCFNPLSLATITAFPQSTPLWHSTVCRARPPSFLPILIRLSADRVFTFCKSSFVILTGFVFFLSCLKKAPCFFYITQYSGRRKESYTQHISAFHQAALE